MPHATHALLVDSAEPADVLCTLAAGIQHELASLTEVNAFGPDGSPVRRLLLVAGAQGVGRRTALDMLQQARDAPAIAWGSLTSGQAATPVSCISPTAGVPIMPERLHAQAKRTAVSLTGIMRANDARAHKGYTDTF